MSAPNPKRDAVVGFTARERKLILLYGYPFPQLRAEGERFASDERTLDVAMEPFELDFLIGQLSHSTNHCADRVLQEELNELCEHLEFEEGRLKKRSRSRR